MERNYSAESFGEFLFTDDFPGSAKVDDLKIRRLLALKQNVFGLQVAVDDFLLVAVLDGREYLLHVFGCHFFGKIFERLDFLKELTSLEESFEKIYNNLNGKLTR